jgi:hypothetical protein
MTMLLHMKIYLHMTYEYITVLLEEQVELKKMEEKGVEAVEEIIYVYIYVLAHEDILIYIYMNTSQFY